jgi:hypothetical protein
MRNFEHLRETKDLAVIFTSGVDKATDPGPAFPQKSRKAALGCARLCGVKILSWCPEGDLNPTACGF